MLNYIVSVIGFRAAPKPRAEGSSPSAPARMKESQKCGSFFDKDLNPRGSARKKTVRWTVFRAEREAGTEIRKNFGRRAGSMQGASRRMRSSPITRTISSIHKGFHL